jgi:membrane protease YdiL (CAAX protease family)
VAAVLFGLAHGGGGLALVAFAGLAGAGYGLALWRSGRIEAAILVHFAVNAVHFLLFTYPMRS